MYRLRIIYQHGMILECSRISNVSKAYRMYKKISKDKTYSKEGYIKEVIITEVEHE